MATLHKAILRRNTSNTNCFPPEKVDFGKTIKKMKLIPFQDYLSPSGIFFSSFIPHQNIPALGLFLSEPYCDKHLLCISISTNCFTLQG